MKINALNIAAFGGLKNVKIEPESGLNVIYGDNENGKSTVMAFIKMMFYGSERGSSQISKNIRKKYTPWDGSAMAGSIDFCHSGRNYRLEREFRSSNSTDRVTLCDLDLGTRTACEPDIGVRFFGLSAAAFERSVFIGQFGFPQGDPEGEIGNRLSNIALTGEESVSYDTVSARLEKAKNALMSKSRTAGIYDKNLKTIAELKGRLERAVATHESYRLSKEKIDTITAEASQKQKKAAALKEKISAEQDIRNANKLKSLLELKGQLDALNEELKLTDGSYADEGYLKKLEFCYSKLQSIESKISLKENEITILKNNISALGGSPEEKKKTKAELESKIAEEEAQLLACGEKRKALSAEESEIMLSLADSSAFKKKINLPILIAGIISLVLGLFTAATYLIISVNLLPIAGILLALGIVLTVLGFIARPTDKAAMEKCRKRVAELRNELALLNGEENKISAELSALKARLEVINTALLGNEETFKNNQAMLIESENQLKELKQSLENENAVIKELFARRKEDTAGDIKAAIEEIAEGAAKQKELKQQINYILKDIGNISYEEAAARLKAITGGGEDLSADFDTLKAEYDSLISAITDLKAEAAAMKARADSAYMLAENPETLKKQITELSHTAANQEQFCIAAQKALEILAESYVEVRRSYGSQLERDSAEILSRLTGGKYSAMTVSKALDISVEEQERFGSREIDYLSSGTADQAYLSLRLALSRLIRQEESLPILMDDALAQYDDERMNTAMEFLKEYSADNQIIIFTCHKNVCEIAEKLNANLDNL